MDNVLNGILTGFVDKANVSNVNYVPKLVVNDFDRKEKVLTAIITELRRCKSFLFNVAFLTQSGVQILLPTFKELEEKGVRGVIIVSEYQYFTQPDALLRLLKFKNIDLRIVSDEYNMHTKGYLFKNENELTTIVGSSNLTQSALSVNKEWNIKVTTKSDGSYFENVLDEFRKIFDISRKVDLGYIDEYRKVRNTKVEKRVHESFTNTIKPNKMQEVALENLVLSRDLGHDKALIISSTGTGKTFLSAFDVKQFGAKKFLFIIHREQIAKDAMNAYKMVLGNNFTYGILSGGNKCDADFIFSTIQTLSKDSNLLSFSKDHFDYIVYDEVHRIDTPSYKKVYNYFTPKFLLGMTATPDRTDGGDIYTYFDHNIAYEIRLQEAMQEDLITPFHYYGVSELVIEGELIDDHSSFNRLVDHKRVDHIIEKITYYGYSGEKVRGLVFVSRNEEAKLLSDLFNKKGFKTVSLSGADSQDEREYQIKRLESNNDDSLDYIFTVDIFNEGIDIPSVNQVVMLRPTQSAIIFIQQLGRGLRKYDDKEYVVVIDFIGNYNNNFLIPIALSGDKSYNKDNIRRFVQEGNNVIPGASTINFESVVKERIFSSIDNAKFNDSKLLKESYFNLKNRLGKIPSLQDFSNFGTIDIMKIISRHNSYYSFLKKYESEYDLTLNEQEKIYIDFVSSKFLVGKRPHELEFIKLLIEGVNDIMLSFRELMMSKYEGLEYTINTEDNIINQFSQNYLTGTGKETFSNAVFIELINEKYSISKEFKECLQNEQFYNVLNEIVEYGLQRNNLLYAERYKNTSFKLFEKYSYEDVFRLLDWEKSEVALNVGGYKHDKKTNTFPIFINYKKEEDISDTIKFEDEFINSFTLNWMSKSGKNLNSPEIKTLLELNNNDLKIPLFVRKNKNDKESKEFYFLGSMKNAKNFKEVEMKNISKTAVKVEFELEDAVREDVYHFITEDL